MFKNFKTSRHIEPEDPRLVDKLMQMKWMEREWDESSVYNEDNDVLTARV